MSTIISLFVFFKIIQRRRLNYIICYKMSVQRGVIYLTKVCILYQILYHLINIGEQIHAE